MGFKKLITIIILLIPLLVFAESSLRKDVLILNPTTIPSAGLAGEVRYDTSNNDLKLYNGSSWNAVDGSVEHVYQLTNVGLAVSISTNTLVVALKQIDGSTDCSSGSPCKVGFRGATITNGDTDVVSFTGATSITLEAQDSIGASGADSLYVYLISDSTDEICLSDALLLDENLYSAVALTGGAETTSSTLYCTSVHTTRPIRYLGQIDATFSGPNWGTIAKVTAQGQKPILNEYIEGSSALTSYSGNVNQWADYDSFSLTPGVWVIDVGAMWNSNGVVSTAHVYIGISTTSGNSSTGMTQGNQFNLILKGQADGDTEFIAISPLTVNVTSTTTYYFKTRADASVTSNLRIAYKYVARKLQ